MIRAWRPSCRLNGLGTGRYCPAFGNPFIRFPYTKHIANGRCKQALIIWWPFSQCAWHSNALQWNATICINIKNDGRWITHTNRNQQGTVAIPFDWTYRMVVTSVMKLKRRIIFFGSLIRFPFRFYLVKCINCELWRPGLSNFQTMIPVLQPTANSPAHNGRQAIELMHFW